MAIIIGFKESGTPQYKSANNSIITDEDKDKAQILNNLIESNIRKFIKDNNLKVIKKNRFHYYWKFGTILREIFYNSEFVDPNEKELFFENVRLHMDKDSDVFPKDDKKRRRNIPRQFFKLAGYPYDVAKRVEWSQWSYLFDNTYLMESTKFDNWFKKILESGNYKFNESFTRLWAESFNLLFKKVDLTGWEEEEFLKPLISTLDIINNLVCAEIDIDSRKVRRVVKDIIVKLLNKHRKEFILMQMGEISKEDFVSLITEKIIENQK